MNSNNKRSIEEQVEDAIKQYLKNNQIKYFSKTEDINEEIKNALEKSKSKSGGSGRNYPDIKLFLELSNGTKIPVMIEIKGTKHCLIKLNDENEIDNRNKDGFNFKNIQKYAVNGALHYAEAIINWTKTYQEVIFIGINGYMENNKTKLECRTYYLSKDNFLIPKNLNYDDLSFLCKENENKLIEKIKNINLTEEEKENKTRYFENQIEIIMKKLNQSMNDDLNISVGLRVNLIVGLIIAGLGVENKVSPLTITDLKGENSKNSNDGVVVINKIKSFLESKYIPEDKKEAIVNILNNVFIHQDIQVSRNGESNIKKIYSIIEDDILPIFKSAKHLDFTGKLFNILNQWVDIPDNEKNDVVLTPRYICELMAKLCKVNKDSYVWDYALGTAGFLISSMKLMIKDAENTIKSETELRNKINKIKTEQVLGIEKRSDIYMLAVLNMILMGDGSSHIIRQDSLNEFDGKYEVENKKIDFPANVFLLNPPYSQKGKGLIFVEKAFKKMKNGKGAILIQENAGSTQGEEYGKEILKNNTLLASIHLSDIFCGKSSVQVAIYVFDVGTPHDKDKLVKFIDFSNDGYERHNRKKSNLDVNLRDDGTVKDRYKEIEDIVLGNRKTSNYYNTENGLVIEDTISLEGNDWTFQQHKKINTVPTENDFKKVVGDFLIYKISTLLREDSNPF